MDTTYSGDLRVIMDRIENRMHALTPLTMDQFLADCEQMNAAIDDLAVAIRDARKELQETIAQTPAVKLPHRRSPLAWLRKRTA